MPILRVGSDKFIRGKQSWAPTERGRDRGLSEDSELGWRERLRQAAICQKIPGKEKRKDKGLGAGAWCTWVRVRGRRASDLCPRGQVVGKEGQRQTSWVAVQFWILFCMGNPLSSFKQGRGQV